MEDYIKQFNQKLWANPWPGNRFENGLAEFDGLQPLLLQQEPHDFGHPVEGSPGKQDGEDGQRGFRPLGFHQGKPLLLRSGGLRLTGLGQTPPGSEQEFLDEVHRLMPDTPNGLGKGIFWREPAVPLRQGIASRGIFYQDGNVLPVITVSDKYTRGRADRAARANPSAGPGRDKGGTPEATPIPARMPTPSK